MKQAPLCPPLTRSSQLSSPGRHQIMPHWIFETQGMTSRFIALTHHAFNSLMMKGKKQFFVNSPITLRSPRLNQALPLRSDNCVSPVTPMVHQSTTGPAAHHLQVRQGCANLRNLPEIPKARPSARPSIDTEHGTRGILEQPFIDRHRLGPSPGKRIHP